MVSALAMARDIVLTDQTLLDGDSLSVAINARSMPVLEEGDWVLLYPLVESHRELCPLLWRIWHHQQGAEADVLIDREQLWNLSAELAHLAPLAGEGESRVVGLLRALVEEAFDSGLNLGFVAD